jgi:hypothetical protein
MEAESKWFEEWQASYNKRRENIQEKILEALKAGKVVGESFNQNYSTIWPDASPFMASVNTPEYLAYHLAARHFGFGWKLYIDGVEYHLGKLTKAGALRRSQRAPLVTTSKKERRHRTMGAKFYHIGLWPKGKALIIQASTNIDCLNCETREYLNGRTTKKELKVGSVNLLRAYNRKYGTHLERAVIV